MKFNMGEEKPAKWNDNYPNPEIFVVGDNTEILKDIYSLYLFAVAKKDEPGHNRCDPVPKDISKNLPALIDFLSQDK